MILRGQDVLQVVQRDRPGAAPAQIGVEMVVQVGPDRRHVAHHRDAHVLQVLRRPQAGQQQQLRGAVGAAGHDDLAARACAVWRPSRRLIFDAGGAVALDQHDFGRMGAGADLQVGAGPRGVEIGLGGAPAPAVRRGGLVVAAAFLLRAVEVGVARDAGLLAGGQHRLGQFERAAAGPTRSAGRRCRGIRSRRGPGSPPCGNTAARNPSPSRHSRAAAIRRSRRGCRGYTPCR